VQAAFKDPHDMLFFASIARKHFLVSLVLSNALIKEPLVILWEGKIEFKDPFIPVLYVRLAVR
jgi:hypothetical protein